MPGLAGPSAVPAVRIVHHSNDAAVETVKARTISLSGTAAPSANTSMDRAAGAGAQRSSGRKGESL